MGSTKMMRLIVSLTLFAAAVMAIPEPIAPVQPHLAQAWTALSTGDGLPGQVGKESYLFEDCKHKGGESDNCKQAHIFDYGVVNYTYFVTQQGNDTISHRIDYSVPMDPKLKAGSILYGDFQVQHDLDTFRQTFVPPPQCLGKGVMSCDGNHIQRVERKYFKHSALRKQFK